MMCSYLFSMLNEELPLTVFGDNTLKLQHMNKSALKKCGMLVPVSITVPYHLFVKATMLLDYPDCFLPKEKQEGYAWKDEENNDP